ncbi:26249_t:CDS:1 [Gigaspora margarita]|uniref:26249_t:CDS:1 n=1 Tax=Gigaspora margarita TaxID=4874 RepID=A0ABM8VVE1_GIGMA|nr:26249_t:CDS:1 [Gigaspora margarita]
MGFWDDALHVGVFVGKVIATGAAATAVVASAGTAAPLVGIGMWAGGKVVEEVGKETDCQFLRAVGSFTKDTGFGSVTAIAFADPNFIEKLAEFGIRGANKVKKTHEWLERGIAINEVREHFEHKDGGASYKRNCSVCNL